MSTTPATWICLAIASCAAATHTLALAQDEPFHELVDLATERLSISNDVALSKWYSGKPIEDKQREEEVLDRIATDTESRGMPRLYARNFFSDLIEASKLVQRGLHDRWHKLAPPLEGSSSLEKSRIRLDEIGERLAAMLPLVYERSRASHCRGDLASAAGPRLVSMDELHRAALTRSLQDVCAP